MTTALRTDSGYCERTDDTRHNCEACSLVSYGRDCHNNPINKTDCPYYLLTGADRDLAEIRQGVK